MASIEAKVTRFGAALSALGQNPASPIEGEVRAALEEAEFFIAPFLQQNPELQQEIINTLYHVVLNGCQDAKLLFELLTKITHTLSFSDILQLKPPVDFAAGLDLNSPPSHSLVLKLLSKATTNASDAAILAGMPTVIYCLVKLWLCTPDSFIADYSESVLFDLLRIDLEASEVPLHGIGDDVTVSAGQGQGLIWRRVFGDKDVYGLLYSIPSLRSNSDQSISKAHKTIAQGRLMHLVPHIGQLDWSYVVRSHHAHIEAAYGLAPSEGLLHFISLYAVDYKSDVLMHINLIEFFADLLSMITGSYMTNKDTSLSLRFLQEHGLHDRSMSFWLTPEHPSHDPIDIKFLYNASADYVSTYSTRYPEAFLVGDEAKSVVIKLSARLDISANQWANGRSPKHDLKVLASMPRIALLPQRQLGPGRQSSPLLLLPCKVTNEDALHTLSKIFAAPKESTIAEANTSIDSASLHSGLQAQATRALLHVYLQHHEAFFGDLISHAATVALAEKALAAINVIATIVSANYQTLPVDSRFNESDFPKSLRDLPSETQLRSHASPFLSSPYYFEDGLSAITSTPARDTIFPWLLQPAQSFANLVGGHGDSESAAYKIAVAKWDLLKLVNEKLQASQVPGLEVLRHAVQTRLAGSPFGSQQAPQARIATLDL